ncbi:MAG: flagellar motor protein [Symploca sp. SIO3E6]|nr:flagellar motor protein [Caldora sp. SIO3E6]
MKAQQLKYAEIFSFLAFIFFIMFIVFYKIQNEKAIEVEIRIQDGQTTNQRLSGKIQELEEELEKSNKQIKNLESRIKTTKQYIDPIIIFPETGKHNFELGKATLSEDFKENIQTNIVPQIENKFENNPGAINTIEVIGHTDGKPIKDNKSNLDKNIYQLITDQVKIEELQAGSNADLGLLRAIAVVKELKKIKKEGKGLKILDNLEKDKVFRAYSAGQLTDDDGTFAKSDDSDDPTRRRIEIRFTKLDYNKN